MIIQYAIYLQLVSPSSSNHCRHCHCSTFSQQTFLHSLQDKKINIISQRTNLALYPDPLRRIRRKGLVHTVRACAKFTEDFLVQFAVYYHYHAVRHVRTRYTKHPKSVKSRHVLLVATLLFFCRYCSLMIGKLVIIAQNTDNK